MARPNHSAEDRVPPVNTLHDRGSFLNLAGLVEGGLALIALAVGWGIGLDPLRFLRWDAVAAAWGALGAVPLVVLLWLSYRYPVRWMQELTDFWTDALGEPLSKCRWYDLVLLAALAGFAEELLFRGLLQVWLERWGWVAALLLSNVLFGLAHCITPLYAVLAGVIGVYLGWLFGTGDDRQLLAPMVTHGLYDYIAFLVVIRVYRTETVSEDDAPLD